MKTCSESLHWFKTLPAKKNETICRHYSDQPLPARKRLTNAELSAIFPNGARRKFMRKPEFANVV
jgi:hypothetical protein